MFSLKILILIFKVADVLGTPIYNAESIEDLVDGFRRQQMFISTTLLNESHQLRLPQKLAQAEAEEAEERYMVAYRAKNEAKIPFISTTSRLNLGYIGRGYDIYLGNPLSDVGEVDQGFRLPVLDLPFSFRFTSDGEYRLPDNVDVISETSASFGSSFHEMKTETDYQGMLQVDASVNARAKGYGFSGSFSASASYKKAVKEITKGESTFLDIVGRASVYKARLSSRGTLSKLSDFLEDAIHALPSEHCEETAIQQLYIEVVEKFGTHFTTEVVMGAKAIQEIRFKKSDIDKFQSVGISAKVAASFSVIGVVKSGGAVGVQNNEQLREMVTSTDKDQREYYIGGSPPSGDFSAGSTESLREWARSAAENPAPIQYKLSCIDSVIKPEYFKESPADLFDKRRCLRKAIFTYCTHRIKADHCALVTTPDGADDTSHTIKFGDFIRVQHGETGQFLALSQNYGIAPGLTIKPFIRVSEITNYDGLLQIVPYDGNEKLGSSVHYGEPFLFKSIEGDMLHMGKVTIMNDNMYSETRLHDIFEHKDEERFSTQSSSRIEDFSIFLKKPTVASYLVSLHSECASYWNPIIFQVELTGNNGTVSVTVNTHCSTGGRRYKWFHALEVESDIGHIHTMTFLGIHLSFKRLIAHIKINTLINGEKRTVVWDRNYNGDPPPTTLSRLTTTVRVIEQETYPVQFTFHSTTQSRLIGQPVVPSDTGLIHVISSMPRKTFWDNGISQVMSEEAMGKVGIREIGPKPHRPISSVCSGLIFPSRTVGSNQYNFEDRILISFEVNVMISYIEIAYRGTSSDFKVAYIHAKNETFIEIFEGDLKTTEVNNTVKIELSKSIPTTGVKIYLGDLIESKDKNISDIVEQMAIGGCASAVIDIANTNLTTYEWKIEPSRNTIQISPFLKVAPIENEDIDIPKLFDNSNILVTKTESFNITLSEEIVNCSFSADILKLYLQRSINTGSLQFKDIKLDKQAENLKITMVVKSINMIEYERGHMTLESSTKNGIQEQSCTKNDMINIPSSTEKLATSLPQINAEPSDVSSTSIIIGFAVLGVVNVLVLLVLVYKTFKCSLRQEDHPQPRSTSTAMVFSNKALNECTTEDKETSI